MCISSQIYSQRFSSMKRETSDGQAISGREAATRASGSATIEMTEVVTQPLGSREATQCHLPTEQAPHHSSHPPPPPQPPLVCRGASTDCNGSKSGHPHLRSCARRQRPTSLAVEVNEHSRSATQCSGFRSRNVFVQEGVVHHGFGRVWGECASVFTPRISLTFAD